MALLKKFCRLSAVAALAGTSACASIVSGTDSASYIETKPVDARCRLHGQDFTREVVTPTSVPLPSKASPITIECNAEGHQRTTQQLEAAMDGWIFGNLIFGGVVDIARGAGKKYPSQVQVVLDPAAFASEIERDAHYGRRIRETNERWDKVAQAARSQCDPGNPSVCTSQAEEIEKKRSIEIAGLETNRTSSRIIPR